MSKRVELTEMKAIANMTKPIPLKAGDKKVIVNGRPLSEDFRIIAEELYQAMIEQHDYWKSRALAAENCLMLKIEVQRMDKYGDVVRREHFNEKFGKAWRELHEIKNNEPK